MYSPQIIEKTTQCVIQSYNNRDDCTSAGDKNSSKKAQALEYPVETRQQGQDATSLARLPSANTIFDDACHEMERRFWREDQPLEARS